MLEIQILVMIILITKHHIIIDFATNKQEKYKRIKIMTDLFANTKNILYLCA